MLRVRFAIAILGLFVAACAAMHTAPPDVRQTLAPTGKLRVGAYVDSPLSLIKDPATGEARGVAFDTGRELAKRLGVPFEVIEFSRAAEVLEALKAGRVDFTVTNATAVRAKDMDFTSPLLLLELGYLVPPGSPISSPADIDRPGVRIGVTQGSTSQGTLPRLLKNATLVPAPSIKGAVEMLQQRRVDAFATNKTNLYQMSDSLPGSRVLDGQVTGVQQAIGTPKTRAAAAKYLSAFADDVKKSGFIKNLIDSNGVRGVSVAP